MKSWKNWKISIQLVSDCHCLTKDVGFQTAAGQVPENSPPETCFHHQIRGKSPYAGTVTEVPESTRDQILQVAKTYLLESGPAGFEAKELAQRGWFNASQVNYYFGNRDSLIAAAADSIFTDHVNSIITAVEQHSDPLTCFRVWCEYVVEFNTSNGATAALVAYPDLFLQFPSEPAVAPGNSQVLDLTERVGTVLMSVLYAIARDKPYRRLNRSKVAFVALAMPRVTNSVVMIGMAAAGLAQVWEQHKREPIFGFDPRKAFLKGANQIIKDLTKSQIPDLDDPEIFEIPGE